GLRLWHPRGLGDPHEVVLDLSCMEGLRLELGDRLVVGLLETVRIDLSWTTTWAAGSCPSSTRTLGPQFTVTYPVARVHRDSADHSLPPARRAAQSSQPASPFHYTHFPSGIRAAGGSRGSDRHRRIGDDPPSP